MYNGSKSSLQNFNVDFITETSSYYSRITYLNLDQVLIKIYTKAEFRSLIFNHIMGWVLDL